MGQAERFAEVFGRLRAILEPYAGEMVVVQDTDGNYYLDTRHVMKDGQPLFFAATRVNKRYVSFYLMPVYAFPDLLADIGDLKKRMQGKSCFNVTSLDDAQVAQLTALTRAGYERYRAEGMLG
ncbi:MAG TPA: DUF1801 domain-containing protein [Thermomicrobiales bacterium]|nr:DUF1801 domain-containing protein [Thermomicrobiales bacterium]